MKALFFKHLLKEYISQTSVSPTPNPWGLSDMLEFLVEHKLIPERSIRHYTIVLEYKELEKILPHMTKTSRIKMLARQMGVHENTVWNVIKDYQDRFIPECSNPSFTSD
ncbi:MAG: transposase family protein [Bacteroidota bacterium]